MLKRVGKICLLSSINTALIYKRLDEEEKSADHDSLFAGTLYNIGFNAFGQMIFAYTAWLFKELKKNNIKKVFLFQEMAI